MGYKYLPSLKEIKCKLLRYRKLLLVSTVSHCYRLFHFNANFNYFYYDTYIYISALL